MKLTWYRAEKGAEKVAPFTGAWIETEDKRKLSHVTGSRTLHGCVD